MTDPMLHVCQVRTPDGETEYVSLLPPEPSFARGLIAEAIVGMLSAPLSEGEAITPARFARNPAFVEFLHSVIARRGPNLPDIVAEAQRPGDGWVYLIDGRTRTPDGPVPPEDLIGAFAVSGRRRFRSDENNLLPT